MANWPARLVWIAINITTNVDEFDQALSSLVYSLVNRVTTGSSVGKFATGEIAYTAFENIYGLVQCVPGLSSADLMGVSILFLLLSCILITLPLATAQPCPYPANFTANSTYGQNRNRILSSLASNATANGGFYTTTFTTQDSDTIYALALCRGDLSNQDCYDCVDTASQSIITNCPNKMEAFDFGASSHCIVRCSNQSFFGTMANWPARLVWVAINITTNVDEFDRALSSLVVSLVNRVTTGSSVGKFATGEIAYTAFEKIYGLVQCVPGLSSADCSSCISDAIYYYDNEDCCFRKRAVNVITPSCIFQYDLSKFYESSAGAAPPPPAPPAVTFSPPPPSTNVTTKGDDVMNHKMHSATFHFGWAPMSLGYRSIDFLEDWLITVVCNALWFEEVLNQPDPREELCKLVDPRLGDSYPIKSVRKLVQLAKACTQENPQLRPSMWSAVVALMTLLSSTEDWDVGSFYENQALVSLMFGSTYGQNRNRILSSLASNATANGGFYTTNFTQGFDDTIYALALCRGDLSNQSCYNCVDTASQSIIVNCPNKMEAFEFGASSHCIVRCSDQSFFSTMAYWPARLVWVAINITTNVDEFDDALSNLVVSLVNRVSTGSSVGKFATGEIAYTAFDKIYGLVQCVPDLSSADCISCISSASYYYRNEDCCFRKRAVSVITPSCIFQYDLSNFYESSAGAAPPPPAPPLVTFSPPPPSTNVTTKGEDESRTIQTTILIVVPVSILLLLTVTVLACGFFRLRKREDVKMTVDCSCLCNLAWIRAAGKLFRASSQHGAHYAGKYLKIEELIIFGYMPPEYAKFGRFSVKTDVFSFGVLILEIVSGKKYSGYGGPEHVEHLISYAWKKWRQGKASRLIDDTLVGGSESEKMRCIHIGLLCVQENVAKRPTMAAVVLMFNSFSMCLPSPSKPGFFVGSSTEPDTALGNRFPPVTSSHHSQEQSVNVSVNEASITDPYPR
ncbi:hypothetical protein RHSIM_Rhsim02G0113100 [Rhododendron simsii]|uniref:Gnk2-homologous domain-containing protein n=1 Tax=Rhododendron simsii TaxID=118357 RepID=A0A834HED7_RHOSS|nr:hypothetical protein RHSIM_Rhsim02G0113100 [Rhododendron simsii]